ncbi:Ribosomal RNA large subunit methyltransferase K/L [Fusobacterium sp. DD29]|uniref:THUMP domain-containing class I SAM-dependent RNA methyltransferase n=1 Tax=unclassified Fusobacterium TaxID=2648384 RepID=UPI001B8C490E|nr:MULTISPECIES: class I SAM-dependent RNA methyltransferase [unclassified Fusobacterium]MBR8701535.1 Ribosomal RNA large subunit methyltransferase K/L [Fusobacterium sp. DD45]MBR8711272.1 Ribosomal RNA large subunit methyltransferase K/L [Fusobacterium sp. DD28]MBR8750119.1 Ribosomal RNA large subunit methyltransferase K/L [Fusobacterium sp. DD29]MBR8751821.1 Ribosomal RNA large subunit methyltransferase K/L [Fusobacterium sp. DD26]MBR8762356.1 Ribosomal RNA large subunit methyltransferase K/
MLEKVTLIASATMGVESIVRDECKELGFENVNAFNGRVEFDGTVRDIAKANIHLRCADRVFLKMGEFRATSFEQLFNNIKKINWGDVIPENGEFPVSWVSSVKCKLYSKSDIQSITKKAIVEKLKEKYHKDYFYEDGAKYAIKIQGNKDTFIVMIDTSGDPLHKRGYRAIKNEAPIKETMAAALVYLSGWSRRGIPLMDPMCGTGTLLIEAAMIARNIAPGSNRNFASEKWNIIPEKDWLDVRDDAFSMEDYDKEVKIFGSDIDEATIEIAKKNIEKAGVEDDIVLECKNFLDLETDEEYGALITNPPYGDRLMDDESVERLYRLLGDVCRMRLPKWSYYIITSKKNFEECFGRKATKNRKLYNGGIECYYYQYYGERKGKNGKR